MVVVTTKDQTATSVKWGSARAIAMIERQECSEVNTLRCTTLQSFGRQKRGLTAGFRSNSDRMSEAQAQQQSNGIHTEAQIKGQKSSNIAEGSRKKLIFAFFLISVPTTSSHASFIPDHRKASQFGSLSPIKPKRQTGTGRLAWQKRRRS